MSKGIIEMTKAELRHIPAVPYTETWHPVHHSEVIETVDLVLAERSIVPAKSHIEVNEKGTEMFANYYLDPGDYKMDGLKDAITIGIRNSMAKRFALGACGGHNVMNCANLCFWGDWEQFRRHTNGLTPEILLYFLRKAIEGSLANGTHMREWFRDLSTHALETEERKLLVYDAIETGILTPSHWGKFHDAYAEELKANRDGAVENLAHFHGATTRVLRDMSLSNVMDRTRKLNALLEHKIAAPEAPADDWRRPMLRAA